MSLVGRREYRPTEKFPFTLVLAGFWLFAFLTLPFIALGVQVDPLASAQAIILFTLLLGGIVLFLVSSLIYTKGLSLVTPDQAYRPLNLNQALIVIGGLLGVAVWQLYINQAYFGSVLAGISGQAAEFFKTDTGIAEDTFFGALAVFTYLSARYFDAGEPAAFFFTLAIVAPAFYFYHVWVAQVLYTTIQQQQGFLLFVLGARIGLTTVLIGTMLAATRRKSGPLQHAVRSGSIAAPVGMHVLWNNLT